MDVSTPKVMGILNITPDSFFDGGKYQQQNSILKRVRQMKEEGADIIDVGAYSSRPGAADVPEKEELTRLFSALELIRNDDPETVISVDTFRANIAREVVEKFKVDMINDISAGDMDEKMFDTIADLQVPYVMMHMKGTPQNMQNNPGYSNDVVYEVIDYLGKKSEILKQMGVHDVLVDPGFGFGKTQDHNYILLSRLHELKVLELPLLIGVSRKSMIYNCLNTTSAEALNGTTALNMVALQNGASFLRVHDVKEAKECVKLYAKLQNVKTA
jgi:dihydropteroate synthase